ncbi:MAG: acyltransferase [Gammaproteobacteria bacterium CG11_big_fil_rev_8_21_14_0_20_46_22]|nr:MAG: acyltransferase [Gammaproteobacteria bacterium CG12_big_fil_rev_8_21_14_0_65_46_12]PIR10683.1 MAG: acyltransferase [Gammaproteobacteria bacterium CG11_big_fil_rev_8_21_14_0_20_46_22]
MRRWLPSAILSVLGMGAFILLSAFVSLFAFLLMLVRMITPVPYFRRCLQGFINDLPMCWGSSSGAVARYLSGVECEVRGLEASSRKEWYLIFPNHQCFSDIVMLHYALDHDFPPLRFFMKNSLKWIPLVGQYCWAAGYPFMKRYTKSQIAKNPKLKGKDMLTTQKACQRFSREPIGIISFVEGTRFTPAKAHRQGSPFKHLLKPKAGGVAFTVNAMQGCLQKLVHVDIVYCGGKPPSMWELYGAKVKKVIVNVKVEPIPAEILGDYTNDRDFRVRFQAWLNEKWAEKDARLEALKRECDANA